MGGFFHGWSRKMGILTLMIALAFMGAWVRSFGRQETFHVCPGRSIFCVWSTDGNFGLSRSSYEAHAIAVSKSINIFNSTLKRFNIGWSTDNLSDLRNQGEYWTGADSERHWRLGGFCAGSASHSTRSDEHEVLHLQVPHWFILAPLSLLSAYLLLGKQLFNNRAPTQDTASISN